MPRGFAGEVRALLQPLPDPVELVPKENEKAPFLGSSKGFLSGAPEQGFQFGRGHELV